MEEGRKEGHPAEELAKDANPNGAKLTTFVLNMDESQRTKTQHSGKKQNIYSVFVCVCVWVRIRLYIG